LVHRERYSCPQSHDGEITDTYQGETIARDHTASPHARATLVLGTASLLRFSVSINVLSHPHSFSKAQSVLRPYPAELMEAHDVSAMVNSARSASPECVEAISDDQLLGCGEIFDPPQVGGNSLLLRKPI
jgi:hypothetical protein